MKKTNILLVIILLFIGTSVFMVWNGKSNDQKQTNQKIDEKILVDNEKVEIKDETEPNDVDPDSIIIGDQICGLTVKEIDSFQGVRFDGKITISGYYEYSDYTGDGDGYIFTVDEEFRSKLPKLKVDPSSNESFILHDFDKVDSIFKRGKGRATIVINNYYLIESQITTDAELIEVIEMKPET